MSLHFTATVISSSPASATKGDEDGGGDEVATEGDEDRVVASAIASKNTSPFSN
jgi:hypothetical protein